jgi:hypothetical protein
MVRQYTGPTRQSYWDDHRNGGMPAIPSINSPAFGPSSYLKRVVRQLASLYSSLGWVGDGRRGFAVQNSALTHETDRPAGDDSDIDGLCVRQTWILLVGKTTTVFIGACTPALTTTSRLVSIVHTQNLFILTASLTVHLTESSTFERSIMNCDK